jgi:hypothetical protein
MLWTGGIQLVDMAAQVETSVDIFQAEIDETIRQ